MNLINEQRYKTFLLTVKIFNLKLWCACCTREAKGAMKSVMSVRLSVTAISQERLIIFFWYFAWRWEVTIATKWRSPIFEKKSSSAFLGQKWPKIRVFWTFLKILSLVFSDFLYEAKGPSTLKSGRSGFSRKNLIRHKIDITVYKNFFYKKCL